MIDKSTDFIRRLTTAQDVSPALRASYQAELDSMLEPKLTPSRALPGVGLLMILVVCVVGIIRNMLLYEVKPLVLVSWGVMAVAFSAAAFYIVRDLWRGTHSQKSVFSIGHILTFAAGTITVAALLIGISEPANPASTFNAFFVFVFYFACSEWAVHNRIAAAELAAREQMLRIECRLADLAAAKSAN
jgi:hypothetical protein